MTQHDFRTVNDEEEYDDEVVIPGEAGNDNSLLAQLRAEVHKDVAKHPITLPVKAHPNIQITYNLNIELEDLNRLIRGSTRRKEVSQIDLAKRVINSYTVAIMFDNKTLTDNGRNLNFRSKAVQDLCDVFDAGMAIKKMFVNDADIIAHFMTIVEGAGYSEDGLVAMEAEDGPLE